MAAQGSSVAERRQQRGRDQGHPEARVPEGDGAVEHGEDHDLDAGAEKYRETDAT